MAISFATLTGAKSTAGSIANWVNYEKIPSTDILTEAQAWIFDRLRCHEMSVSASVTITIAVEYAPLPTDFISPIALKIDASSCPVANVIPADLMDRREYNSSNVLATADPEYYAIMNGRIEFDVLARASATSRFFYHKRPAALSAAAGTNFLTTKYPTLLRRACLAYAYEYRKNTAQYERFIALAEKDVNDANRNADLIYEGAA